MNSNKYPWELVYTTNLMLLDEILTFHIFRYEYLLRINKKAALEELKIISTYLELQNRERKKKNV